MKFGLISIFGYIGIPLGIEHCINKFVSETYIVNKQKTYIINYFYS